MRLYIYRSLECGFLQVGVDEQVLDLKLEVNIREAEATSLA